MTTAALPVPIAKLRRVNRVWLVLGVVAVWVVLWELLYGQGNVQGGGPLFLQDWFQHLRDTADSVRNTSPLFVHVLDPIATATNSFIDQIQTVFDNLGWTGVTGIATAIALVVAGWRYALLTLVGFLSFGVLGLWFESTQTLNLTILSVFVSLLIGIPLGVWAGVSRRFNGFITPVLDVMQIMPSFAYLPLITLFFLIGPASGAIATMIYAIPPAIRLTAAGIREVAPSTVEASRSLGATGAQLLRHVQLPLAKGPIVLGVNQTMMAALSMVTIAALIGAPGLGEIVYQALTKLDVGTAFNAGLAIVFMAIVFDRVTTAASVRSEHLGRASQARGRRRRVLEYGGAAVVVLVGVLLPALVPSSATFPESWVHSTAAPVNAATDWIQLHWYTATSWITNTVTTWLINPLQSLLTMSPAVVTISALAVIAAIVGRFHPAAVTVCCLVGTILLGVWDSSMVTLTAVLIGAALTMGLGVVFGVWMGRNRWVDHGLRPVLDAAQVMPPFVYLVPCLALFGATRFTGIVAAIIYAAPAVIKIVGEGIRGVPTNSIEAGEAAGSNSWQMITKIQLPMSRTMLKVALNQGIIFVLAMVVVGGLVGAGGLGYDVIQGFAQSQLAGLGIAAGLAIVLLGIMLDRITQSAGRDERRSGHTG